MPNETDDLKKPELDESKDTSGHNEIDRIANKAAAKAGKRENRYDQNHGTFPPGRTFRSVINLALSQRSRARA